jgi:hypothetical protein
MKKVRDIPPEYKDPGTWTQTPEYQKHLADCVEEEGQLYLAKSFMNGKEDEGLPLFDLDYEVLRSMLKPIPNDLDEKHTIWEEGEDVCYSYGVLILRGLIRMTLQSGKNKTWLFAVLTEQGKKVLDAHTP